MAFLFLKENTTKIEIQVFDSASIILTALKEMKEERVIKQERNHHKSLVDLVLSWNSPRSSPIAARLSEKIFE